MVLVFLLVNGNEYLSDLFALKEITEDSLEDTDWGSLSFLKPHWYTMAGLVVRKGFKEEPKSL